MIRALMHPKPVAGSAPNTAALPLITVIGGAVYVAGLTAPSAAESPGQARHNPDRPLPRKLTGTRATRFDTDAPSVGPKALPGSSVRVQRVASLAVLVRIARRW